MEILYLHSFVGDSTRLYLTGGTGKYTDLFTMASLVLFTVKNL